MRYVKDINTTNLMTMVRLAVDDYEGKLVL